MLALPLPIYRTVYKYIYDSVMKDLIECYYTTLTLKTFWTACSNIENDSFVSMLYRRVWLFKRKGHDYTLWTISRTPMHISTKTNSFVKYVNDNAS